MQSFGKGNAFSVAVHLYVPVPDSVCPTSCDVLTNLNQDSPRWGSFFFTLFVGVVYKRIVTCYSARQRGMQGFLPWKTVSQIGEDSEKFYSNDAKRAWSTRGHSSDGLVIEWVRVSIIKLRVPVSLRSTCLWAAYHQLLTSPTWRGFQYLQNSSKILLCVSLDGEMDLTPGLLLTVVSPWSHISSFP